MEFTHDHQLIQPECKCPVCGALSDYAAGEANMPKDGDYVVCIRCTSLNRYKRSGKYLEIDKLKEGELEDLSRQDPELFSTILSVQKQLREVHKLK